MKTIPVFYCPQMSVDSRGYSPSASKPEQVLADWQKSELPLDIRTFPPATPDDLFEVHDPRHVLDVLDGRTANGHGNTVREVSNSCLWTVGSFVAAALEAAENGRTACSPTSGFHHAGYDFCGGFCTFNGLMVAARRLYAGGIAAAILDCDAHFGDGTQDLIDRMDPEHSIPHWTFGRDADFRYEPHEFENQVRQFIRDFASNTEGCRRVLLYQAGADVHVNDPLGPGFDDGMTSETMRLRDRLVFTECRKLDIPVVWNLAGGYQRDNNGGISRVLELHRATMEECVRCFVGDSDSHQESDFRSTPRAGFFQTKISSSRILR
ncbi:MAG: histone deacetylase [Planctomyces sp.]